MWVISSSCGNDSVALIRWAIESKIKKVVVTYIDTGWAAPNWQERVDKVRD